MKLVTVFETTDASLVAIVKSLLDGAGIEYVAQGDALQNLFPMNLFGPVRFQVGADDADRARALLADLKA